MEPLLILGGLWLLSKMGSGSSSSGHNQALAAGHRYLMVQPFGGAAPPIATLQSAADGTQPGQWKLVDATADGKNLTIIADALKANPAYPVPPTTTTFIDVTGMTK